MHLIILIYVIYVKYDDLVTQPEKEIRKIYKFMECHIINHTV